MQIYVNFVSAKCRTFVSEICPKIKHPKFFASDINPQGSDLWDGAVQVQNLASFTVFTSTLSTLLFMKSMEECKYSWLPYVSETGDRHRCNVPLSLNANFLYKR